MGAEREFSRSRKSGIGENHAETLSLRLLINTWWKPNRCLSLSLEAYPITRSKLRIDEYELASRNRLGESRRKITHAFWRHRSLGTPHANRPIRIDRVPSHRRPDYLTLGTPWSCATSQKFVQESYFHRFGCECYGIRKKKHHSNFGLMP